MNKLNSIFIRVLIAFVILTGTAIILSNLMFSNNILQPKSQYNIIRSIYLTGAYVDLNNKQLNKEKARAYLEPELYYKKSSVAFQCRVPTGSIMTIIGPAPKVWHLPFFPKRYFVQLEPDLSRGLDIIIELSRGLDGNLDGLNPEIFRRLE